MNLSLYLNKKISKNGITYHFISYAVYYYSFFNNSGSNRITNAQIIIVAPAMKKYSLKFVPATGVII